MAHLLEETNSPSLPFQSQSSVRGLRPALCKAVINNMRVTLTDSRFGVARSEMATLILQPADNVWDF